MHVRSKRDDSYVKNALNRDNEGCGANITLEGHQHHGAIRDMMFAVTRTAARNITIDGLRHN